MAKYTPARYLLLGMSVLVLLACSAPAAAPPPATAPAPTPAERPAAPAPEPARIEFGMVVPVAHYWAYWVAQDQGLFREQQLTVEATVTETPSRAIQALVGGSLDISGGGPDSVALANNQGADVVIVAGQNNRVAYALLVHPSVQTYADLRGKQFAVSDLQDGSTVLLRRLLAANGLRPEEYDLLPVGGTSARLGAIQNGAVIGAMIGQPQEFRAVDSGLKRLGYSTSVVPNYTFEVLSVRREWARANEDRLVRFLRAYTQACRWLYDPAHRADAIRILATNTRTDENDAARTYALYIEELKAIPQNGEVSLPGVAAVLDSLVEVGVLTPPAPPPERLVDESYLRKAQGQ